MEKQVTIKDICCEFELGQTALARRFGIPIRTVQQWYTGERKPPSYVIAMIKQLLEIERNTKTETNQEVKI